MTDTKDRLFDLLPVVHRRRDAEKGWPLRALLQVIAEQIGVVEKDIARLYENWFIETCEDWVVPYIGDLVGFEPVYEAGQPGEFGAGASVQRNKILVPRREVANTLRSRRRKGTLALLELLAKDVADWPARAVEFYTLLSVTQALNYLHLDRGRTVDLRRSEALDRIDGPFDETAHTVEVRRVNSARTPGRYNIPSVGLFVWRLRSYSVTHAQAYRVEQESPDAFTFSSLSNDLPLFVRPAAEDDPTRIAGEFNLPVPLTRRVLAAHLSAFYGENKSLQLWLDTPPSRPVAPDKIVVSDLEGWRYEPALGTVAVDPERGRILFAPGEAPQTEVWVSYHYGFPGDFGGGEYPRPLSQISVQALGAMRMAVKDIRNPQALLTKLKTPPDLTSQYARSRLSDEMHDALELYDDSFPPEEALINVLVHELNQVLQLDDFYDATIFADVSLTEEMRALIRQNPAGAELARLNRLLLELTFPEDLFESFIMYRVGLGEEHQNFSSAYAAWLADKPRNAVIEITDNREYAEKITIELEEDQSLQVRAANRRRPVIRLLDWGGGRLDAFRVIVASGSRFTLDGLLVSGRGVQIEKKDTPLMGERTQTRRAACELPEVTIRHTTLVPGWSLDQHCDPQRPSEASVYLFNAPARVTIAHSIIGAIRVQQDEVETDPSVISIYDSIVDATDPEEEAISAPGKRHAHAVLIILRSTVSGTIQAHAIDLAENSILYGCTRVARRQRGCIRFSYVAPDSRTPRRYNSQPDLARKNVQDLFDEGEIPTEEEKRRRQEHEEKRVRPQFNSVRNGEPAYFQLAHATALEIKRGAEDESEMGVYHDLFQPQREANLRLRLDEYTPAGMNAGIIFAS